MTIAVLVPTTAGRGHFLATALASVHKQSDSDWRVLLWGDGYRPIVTGTTKMLVGSAPNRLGEAASRNSLLEWWRRDHSDCELACWLDDDDIMHPARLELQGAFFRGLPEVDLAFTGLGFFEDGWREEGTLLFGRDIHPAHFAHPESWVPYDFQSLRGNFTSPTAMFRPSVAAVPYRTEVRTGGCDMVWYYELFMRGYNISAVHSQLYYLRRHPGRLTKTRDQLPKKDVEEDLVRLYDAVEDIKLRKLAGVT